MKKPQHTIWLAIAAIASILWLPHLFALGMFMDGVYDALLALNLHLGVSTFWAPQATSYTEPAYWDNPPLSMWFLSLFYDTVGNHYYVERLYSLLCAVIQMGLIAAFWKTVFRNDSELKKLAWLPVLLWLISPLISWSYSNNLMENTMSIFTTLASIFLVNYIINGSNLITTILFAAIFLVLAFITKGPVSLFPLAIPVLFFRSSPPYNLRKTILLSVTLGLFFFVLSGALLWFEEPRHFFEMYFEVQLKKALLHNNPESYKPYSILMDLLIALSPTIVLWVISNFAYKKRVTSSLWWRFVLVGLSASLPIILSLKQRKFYLLPAMIPFVIGFSILIARFAQSLVYTVVNKYNKFLSGVAIVLICLSLALSFTNKGKVVREENMLSDLKTINEMTAGAKVIRADWFFYSEWHMQAYLYRLYQKKICMPYDVAPVAFYLTKREVKSSELPANAVRVFSGKTVDLYSLQSAQ